MVVPAVTRLRTGKGHYPNWCRSTSLTWRSLIRPIVLLALRQRVPLRASLCERRVIELSSLLVCQLQPELRRGNEGRLLETYESVPSYTPPGGRTRS
jgi:hypothetical protein